MRFKLDNEMTIKINTLNALYNYGRFSYSNTTFYGSIVSKFSHNGKEYFHHLSQNGSFYFFYNGSIVND